MLREVCAQGKRCENPTAESAILCAQPLRVQGSFAMQPVKGNLSSRRLLFHVIR